MSDADAAVLDAFRQEFASVRRLAERALAQVDDEAFFRQTTSETNSIAVLAKHVGGNLRSRWTDIFTTDGEKPDRNRDGEFEAGPADTRAAVETIWRAGWDAAERTFAALSPEDLTRTIHIRGEAHSVVRALTRSLAHTAGHVHQVVLLAKEWQGSSWQTLSIPRRTRPA